MVTLTLGDNSTIEVDAIYCNKYPQEQEPTSKDGMVLELVLNSSSLDLVEIEKLFTKERTALILCPMDTWTKEYTGYTKVLSMGENIQDSVYRKNIRLGIPFDEV